MEDIGFKYYFFGSEDSQDLDVLIDCPNASGTENDSKILKKIEADFPNARIWNKNIIKINDGIVVCSIPSKGSPDSVNNSLFSTYHFHKQPYGIPPLKGMVERNVLLAIVKCLREILTCYKRTSLGELYTSKYKMIINRRLFSEWLSIIDQIPFPKLENDEKINANMYKRLAFRIGQTISLLKGIEIYTKNDLSINHPSLSPVMRREDIDAGPLVLEKLIELKTAVIELGIFQHERVVVYKDFALDMKTELEILI